MDERKCLVLSVIGVDGTQAMYASLGRRFWYRCRMWEVVLAGGMKRLQHDWWSLKGRRSQCKQKPCLALQVAVVIVMMSCTGPWAEKPKAAGGKPELIYEDCRGWF